MKNRTLSEVLIPLLLIALLALFLNPFSWYMPSMLVMSALCLLVLLFFIFGVFIWKEKAVDEREQIHKMLAGRIAFLVGSAVLIIGICVQEYQKNLDPWLVYTLAAMVLAKLITFLYGRHRL